MTQQPHETPQFQHAAEFTIAVTFVVAGGKRWRTANQRAQRIFEQIANYTTRLGHIVEITAVAGPSHKGKITWPGPIPFAAANTDPLPAGKPNRFHRYLTPNTTARCGRWPRPTPPSKPARKPTGNADSRCAATTPTPRCSTSRTAAAAPTATPRRTCWP